MRQEMIPNICKSMGGPGGKEHKKGQSNLDNYSVRSSVQNNIHGNMKNNEMASKKLSIGYHNKTNNERESPPLAELYSPVTNHPDYSSAYHFSNRSASKSLEGSINAERFVPQHKRLQWNVFPDTLIVVGNGIDMENQALSDWLHNPNFRRSSYDLSFVNMLQFVPHFVTLFQESKKRKSTFWIHARLIPHLLPTIQSVQNNIMTSQSTVRNLESKFAFFAELEQPALDTIDTIRKTYMESSGKLYNENRIIRTTAETVARVCDEIHNINHHDQELILEHQELHKLVCRDYIARTRMLVDIERDKTLEDLKAYDLYSHKFQYIEIPPPSPKISHCIACVGSRKYNESSLNYCAYHYNLSQHNSYQGTLKSLKYLERRKYSDRASVVQSYNQQINFTETLRRMTDSQDKLVGHFLVPGVAEKRPLVSVGDLLRLRFHNNNTEVICEVAEVEVRTERVAVFLPVYKELNPYTEALCYPKNRKDILDRPDNNSLGRFDVRFGLYQTRGYELFHNIISTCSSNDDQFSKLLRVVAPTKHNNKIVKKADCRLHIGISDWCNQKLNAEQKNAVFDIVRNNHGSVPYMINGPAGTGKTTTVLEGIIQVLRYDQSSKILVCAPSDTACDVIASRLLSNLPKKSNGDAHTILRVNWWSRNPASLPPILLSCSPTERMSGLFKMPTAAQIQDSSIIICQCFVAGCLEIGSHTPWMENHFTHVFIDESSQSFEYESLIPLLKVGRKCSIVLSGDPKQLGPTVRSITANQNGLALSLQERLMGLPLYKNHGFCVSTELIDNYRSHEVLLQVSSELFYNGNLRCKAPKEITSVCEGLELLPRADFPLVVYDVEGEEKNKIDTPSFFNIEECYTIVKLIKAVLHSSPDKIHTGQISVITCFRAQVLKMREIFRSNNLASVNIGVVEDFQGQESLVVFISTVLTKDQKRWETGAKRGLGFMTDPKRFNVAITRASALCVIVGNLNFLEKSGTYWTALIEHVRRNNGITGENYEIPDDEKKFDDEEDFGISYFLDCVKSMKLLGIGHEIDRYDMAMRGYFQDSPEWKVCL